MSAQVIVQKIFRAKGLWYGLEYVVCIIVWKFSKIGMKKETSNVRLIFFLRKLRFVLTGSYSLTVPFIIVVIDERQKSLNQKFNNLVVL